MLTRRQEQVLLFVQTYIAANGGVAPSYVDIIDACGMSSRASVHRVLRSLQESGRIRVLPCRARAIEVLRPVPPKYFVFNDETKLFDRWHPPGDGVVIGKATGSGRE